MPRPLASSNLRGYYYDPESRVLTIQFNSGRSYRYADVPADVADGLGSADSPGRYFNGSIKGVYAET